MKKLSTLFMLFCFATGLFAQVPPPGPCTANLTGPNEQFVPDTLTDLPNAPQGSAYSTVLQMYLAASVFVNGIGNVPITDYTITGISGLPSEFTYATNPLDGVIPGGSAGCIVFDASNVTSAVGNYPISINITANTQFGPQTAAFNGFSINITGGGGGGSCTPTLTGPNMEFQPDTVTDLPFATSGTAYATVIQVYMPAIVSGTSLVDYTITGIAGLPSDFSYTVNPSSGIIPGGSAACIYIYSNNVTSPVGSYDLTINGIANVGFTTVPNPINGYTLVIQGGTSCTASISPNGPTTFCQGGSVVLTASAGSSYSWSNGAIVQSITVSQPGSYSVTVVDGNGCSATSNAITVTVNNNPTVSITNLQNFTNVNAVRNLVGSPSGGTFSGVGVSGNTFTASVAGLGTTSVSYSVTTLGCIGTSTQSTIVYDTIGGGVGCSTFDTLIINALLTGVNPPNNTNTFKVYPNPANTSLVIDNGNFANLSGYSVKIINTLGQTVFTSAINQQQFTINLSTWTGVGIYHLQIINSLGASIETKQIVLQ